jgi:hypothetical protein
MWWLLAIPFFVLLLIAVFEYRVRQPDRIVLYESKGEILRRSGRYYPRHFSLSIPSTVQSFAMEVPTEAKGRVGLIVRLTAAAVADPQGLDQLIRFGGWDSQAVERATEELRVAIQGLMREFTSRHEVEILSTGELSRELEQELRSYGKRLGLEVISVTVQSIDPTDPEIAETLREREAARIRERTEKVNQEARIAAAKARVDADAQIAQAEHDLELKRLSLKREQEGEQAQLERIRVQEELDRRRMQLEMDRAEVELVAQNPELLILTPQVARLAEASQSLRNARTIVSLSGEELPEGSSVLQTLLSLLRGGVSTGEVSQKPGAPETKEA